MLGRKVWGIVTMIWVSAILAASVPIIIVAGLWSRGDKGIGWQFIRFVVLTISVPTIGLLALNNSLTGEASTLVGAAMAYAFGKASEKSE
jgi:hypothetical protein